MNLAGVHVEHAHGDAARRPVDVVDERNPANGVMRVGGAAGSGREPGQSASDLRGQARLLSGADQRPASFC